MTAASVDIAALSALEQAAQKLLAAGRFEEAEALLAPSLASGTGPLRLWRLLAHALRPQGKLAATRTIQEMLVANLPGDYPLRFDLAETLLLLGEFERGWREYRYRYSLAHTTRFERKVQLPRWDGQPLPGKTLLIHDEQGYGDTFQFMRMVPWAKARSGARVVLEVNAEALPLARRIKGYDALVVRGELPPAFDQHCEMMSLPMAMQLKLADLPCETPYLSADPERVAHWRARLADLPRPLVALVWAGRPTHGNDANRSLPLARLAPLESTGASFVSIQKGPAEAQASTPPAGMPLLALSDEIRDFEDTAAILTVVDLLISVDSSPVHLAGALGRPVWVMLPFVPDWRWLLGRDDSPWYPSMRLYRQPRRGDWDSVMQALAADLTRVVTDTRRSTELHTAP
ncbi:glycosyl transferase family 8 [Paraburkholderia sp. J67]|uniref:glycosyl transferase family 8 n=1 Tax=Paraburkholderia sp. J67 TaxID=2805435 RepID=UPI002ABD5DCC|nr:glycosyl transferase family 8 [Paraburkholderia sp. J67]